MKVFILNPFLFTAKLSYMARKRQPLDLAYIASLFRNDFEIKLLDANALNLSLLETIGKIEEFKPDILILTSTPIDRWEVPSHKHLKLLIDNILKIIDSVKISYVILLGAHGSLMPEWLLKKSRVNFLVRGEPELATNDLVRAILKGGALSQIRGISYMKDGEIINNPPAPRNRNLDDLPFPAYDLLPMEKYRYTFPDIPVPFSLMLSSRGCPFNCTYCLKVMMAGPYIARSPKNVVAEMEYLVNKFGVQGIYFQDWEFLINQERVAKICDLIIEKGMAVKWGANARASDVNGEVVKKMKAAGCVRINIGFETGSQKVLDLARKQIKISDIERAVAVCRQFGINIGIYSILNLPGETKETIKESEKFLADNNLQTMVEPNLPIPYFGTPLYEMLKEQEGQDFDWENLEKYAGRVMADQPAWLARLYRWHYKHKFSLGKWYFFKPTFLSKLFKFVYK